MERHESSPQGFNEQSREQFFAHVEEVAKRALDDDYVGDIYHDDELGNYAFFPPLDHFRKGLIDQVVLKKLSEGGTALSVGIGDALLEVVLWKGFNIPENQISIADKKFHSKTKKLPFQKYQFDMVGEWPAFPHSFDYILFPESFGVAFNSGGMTPSSYYYFEKIEDKVKNNQEIPASELEPFLKSVEINNPIAQEKLSTIEQALLNLNNGGEVRFSSDLMNKVEEAYIKLKLKEKYPSVEMFRNEVRGLVIRKN